MESVHQVRNTHVSIGNRGVILKYFEIFSVIHFKKDIKLFFNIIKVIKRIKKLILYYLKRKGYELVHANFKNQFSMEDALARCVSRGLQVNTVIDVGASNGCWSRICRKYLPNAYYLLIEAQEPHKNALASFCTEFPNSQFIIAAAGKNIGKIYFDNSGLFGGVASDVPFEGNCIEVPVTNINYEIQKRSLKPPFLIKLDTHGYEIPILEGASEILSKSNLLIIETYNYRITDTSLTYFELAQYLEDKGFSTIELADLMLRQKDKSFWQMDTFFIPSDSREFDTNTYE